MSIVVDTSISLDGYVTGPNAGPSNGLGDGGDALHTWAFSDGPDKAVLNAATQRSGAVVMGRRTFDIVDRVWDDKVGYGAGNAAQPPCFVVTHSEPDQVRLTDRMTIVTEGIESALVQATAAAGDGDVVVMGGGDLAGQILELGLADELSLHIAPVILGAGTPLFRPGTSTQLEHLATVTTANAEHVRYRIA